MPVQFHILLIPFYSFAILTQLYIHEDDDDTWMNIAVVHITLHIFDISLITPNTELCTNSV